MWAAVRDEGPAIASWGVSFFEEWLGSQQLEKGQREAEGNQEKVGSWETKQERVLGRRESSPAP